MKKQNAKKKKVTIDDLIVLKNDLSNFIETGFVGINDERDSQDIAKMALLSIFDYIETLQPKAKRKGVIVKGYENDEEIVSAIYNIPEVLTVFDRNYEILHQRKPNYKTDSLAPTKAKLICQKTHIFLRNLNVKNITTQLVVNQVCRLLNIIPLISWARPKYSLIYIESTFDSLILEAIKMKQNMAQQAEALNGAF